ncbi:MAG TPA: GWxTD domain-containing protein [Gemmatimonadales bacterium]|nr:GWxTD domain-containing protein [Gemmatimonadales bacterium]
MLHSNLLRISFGSWTRKASEPKLTRPKLPLVLLLVLLRTSPTPLIAQHSPARNHFTLLRGSLEGISDTTLLRNLLRSSRTYQKTHPAETAAAWQSGLVALRLGRLGADPDFGTALSIFRAAARQAPGLPESWYGIALAEEGRSDWEMSVGLNLGNRVGLKALERSVTSYQRALAADPQYEPAALALGRLVIALKDTARIADAVPLLQGAARQTTASADVILTWGRVERAAGNLDVAAKAFQHYVSLPGANAALGFLELARTQLASGSRDGEKAYYEGASGADDKVAAEYLSDINPYLEDSSLMGVDTLDGPALAHALRRFWTQRDWVELRGEGERLREHYRRLQYARRHFPLTISRRFYGALDAYRSGSAELDDRGIIYIRHGEPTTRLRPFVFGTMPNESWRYARAEGDLLLHFSGGWDHNGGGDLYDYRLVQSVLDLRGAADAPPDQLLLSRQSLSTTYARMLNWGRYGAANARARERSIGAASIAVGTTTDTYELQFPKRLGVVADLIAVGRTAAGSLTHFVFGIAASTLTPERHDGKVQYRLRLRLVALDGNDAPISSLDTLLTVQYGRPLNEGEFVVGRAEMVLPPGKWRYRASLQQGENAGVVLPRDSVEVADTRAETIQLSDIALGSRGRAISWVSDAADTVLLAPTGLLRKKSDVELYYEATGAQPGLKYRHEITVLRAEGRRTSRRQPLVALSFEEDAANAVIRSHRSVYVSRLKEGRYVIEIRVSGGSGPAAVRRRGFTIIDK